MNDIMKRSPARWGLLADDFDNLFEGFFRPTRWAIEESGKSLVPAVDIHETENEYLVRAELPGVRKEDIEVSMQNGLLTINAESRSETEEKKGGRVIRQERRYGKWVRSMRLGAHVDDKRIKAAYKDGVLELTLPKAEEVKPKKIEVQVS